MDIVDTIEPQSRDEFVQFMKLLRKELQENSSAWTNNTLADFLEALQSWTEDMEGYYLNTGRPVPTAIRWDVFADMLRAARMYE